MNARPFRQALHNKSQSICGSRCDRQEVQTQRYTSDKDGRVMRGIDLSERDENNPFVVRSFWLCGR